MGRSVSYHQTSGHDSVVAQRGQRCHLAAMRARVQTQTISRPADRIRSAVRFGAGRRIRCRSGRRRGILSRGRRRHQCTRRASIFITLYFLLSVLLIFVVHVARSSILIQPLCRDLIMSFRFSRVDFLSVCLSEPETVQSDERVVSREGFQRAKTENPTERSELSCTRFPGVGHFSGTSQARVFIPTFSQFPFCLLPRFRVARRHRCQVNIAPSRTTTCVCVLSVS
jgi:hypothetical protein